MAKAPDTERRFFFLGSGKELFEGPLPPHASICRDRAEVATAASGLLRYVTWISFSRTFTDILLEMAVDLRIEFKGSHLLTLTPPRPESIPALLGLFNPVFGLVDGFRWLPKAELIKVMMREDAADRFIGGSVDPKAKVLTLLGGDMQPVVAPFSLFPRSGDGTEPDFTRLRFTDFGRTIGLGAYEVATDAVLYELDPEYRRKLNKQRRQSDCSFGASLMRLRIQRRLRRSDFAPVSSKAIARIERDEVEKPHARTLEVIAERLGVRPEEIESY